MAYTKQTWIDDDPSVPLSAERFNHMEQGIYEASLVAGVFDGDSDAIDEGTEHLFLTAAERVKLTNIETAATVNSSDADLRDRSTHTGTQAISTIDGLQEALDTAGSGVDESAVRGIMEEALVAGDGVTITPVGETLVVSAEASSPVLVLGATDPIPSGTPVNTLIVRTA